MDKKLINAALIRAERTAIEYVIASIPPGLIVTPVMLQDLDLKWAGLVFAAWLITGVLQTGAAFLAGIKTGLPEVDDNNAIKGGGGR